MSSSMELIQAEKLKQIVNQLYDIDGLKFGNFIIKSGQASPVYIDLRVIISQPKLLESVALLMWELKGKMLKCDSICGVPYNALPIASIISVNNNIPMLIRRKEAKQYGTKKLIEGDIKPGDRCVIIEDVVTTGSSILETVKDLQNEGLNVTDAIVLVDRDQGGKYILAEHGIELHSLCSLMKMMHILKDSGRIDQDMIDKVQLYLQSNQSSRDQQIGIRLSMTYEARAELSQNCITKKLLKLISKKKSNLCVAADVTTSSELIELAQHVGPYVCILKTHADLVDNFTESVADELILLAKKYHFMILEDRKFADIGSTVAQQYKGGVYNISRWADLITAHALSGEGMLKSLQQEAESINADRGCFLLAEMSCAGNLITPHYTQAVETIAKQCPGFVVGLVCQSPLAANCPDLVQLTPGVRKGMVDDGFGQQWVNPEQAILKRGADIVVVGRGITKAKDRAAEAKAYQEELWSAYEKRVGH